MKVVFVLHRYFPYGGLQRDFLRIAEACAQRGHHIQVLTRAWEGEVPAWLEVMLIESRAFTNHGRNRLFAQRMRQMLPGMGADVVVGFNRMPGLDVYFAADPCFASRLASRKPVWLYRLLPRYRQFLAEERALLADSDALILALTRRQIDDYRRLYQVPEQRFQLLPPGIARDRAYNSESLQRRQALRQANHIGDDEHLLLLLGSGFRTKGLDRAIRALHSLPQVLRDKTRLFVVGADDPAPFQRLASQLGVEKQVHFWGGRDDVADFLFAADLLLHPAYNEAAGMALIESLVAGLPVIATAVCGYAHYIRDCGGGEVIEEPFDQAVFNRRVQFLLENPALRQCYHEAGVAFGATAEVYDMSTRAAQLIESRGELGHGELVHG